METNINNKRVHIHFQGLRKKVIKNYIVLVFIMVILFEILFTIYIQNSYYSSVEQQLQAQVNYTEWNYSSSTLGSVGFERKINTIFERQDSSKTAKFGVSFIDKNRNLVLDQYGFKGNNEKIYGEDVESALKNSDEHKPYIYRIKGTNEHVMSVSVAIKSNNIIYGAVRFTISLKEIDKAIVKQALIIGLSGFVILLIGVLISLRFAQTLVNPLIELKSLATQLANGNYKVKFNNVLHVDDEIGELAQTFEYMAHEIERGEKVKDEFISSISHELRTPLTSIKGWSETLSLDNITKDELSLGLGIIQDETSRLIRLVEELLDFSRLSSERIKIVFEEVDFAILVVGVINQLKPKAAEKQIDLLFEFEKEDMQKIKGDKGRLRQVLINIIQNSLKFTDMNGYVKVFIAQDENFTTVKVEDNGAGIENQNLTKVLDRFFQEDYNKAGSGLGLAISNEIIKLHGGDMNIQSEKNEGTIVTFRLNNNVLENK